MKTKLNLTPPRKRGGIQRIDHDKVLRMYSKGVFVPAIAEACGCTQARVYQIVRAERLRQAAAGKGSKP